MCENQNIVKSIEEYTKYKKAALTVTSLIQQNDIAFFNGKLVGDKGAKIEQCGQHLYFEGGHLVGADFCRQRICPMCQYRNSMRQYARMLQVAERLGAQGYRFLHLVLTVPNCSHADLAKTVQKLYDGYGKLMHEKRIKKAFKGALRALEVSFNAEKWTFHPHLHCLIAVRMSYFSDTRVYCSHKLVKDLWKKYTGADQVHITAVKPGDWQGVAEVCKYCAKPFDYMQQPQAAVEMITALGATLKGRRFVQRYGVIRTEYKAVKEAEAEPGEVDCGSTGRYSLHWEHDRYCARLGG